MVRSRRWGCLIAGLGILAAASIAAPTAQAAPITTQPYLESSGITALHAQGLDGSGVKIAIIDGPIDTSVPELIGVSVVQKAICKAVASQQSVSHGTTIASILASPAFGWAPKATILSYYIPLRRDGDVIDYGSCPVNSDSYGFLIHQALNDGADVIVISSGANAGGAGTTDPTAPGALIRAADMGVPVVIGMGNDSKPLAGTGAIWNTVVGVGAIDESGKKADYSNYGDGLVVMAYGGPLTARLTDGTGYLDVKPNAHGTSYSGPMVAGALALAKQKWPSANGNQLTRVLADTADGKADHMSYWTKEMGFGPLNAPLLVATDPTGYDTTNSFMDKIPGGKPSAKDVHDFHDGLIDPFLMNGFPDYVYRGCDPDIIEGQPISAPEAKMSPGTAPECQTASPSSSATEPATPETSPSATATQPAGTIPWLPIGVAAGVVLLGAVLLAVWLSRRRRPPRGPSGATYVGMHAGATYPIPHNPTGPQVPPVPGWSPPPPSPGNTLPPPSPYFDPRPASRGQP